MAIRTHMCHVMQGEGIADQMRVTVPVVKTQTKIYSGSLFQIDSNGRATVSVTTPFNPAYVAHRGVECSDVRGVKAILSTQTGGLVADGSGNGVISGIMLRAGLVIATTEYHTTGSYAYQDALTGVTGNGKWKKATSDSVNEALGYVLQEGIGVRIPNVPYAKTRKMIKIQITRSGYGL